ncbi:hypothetical protein [Absidia glauca]|uniref:Uncharacterized protein n=1 Tax=Absidia glauca TaxID=4829 RepID=A0A163JGI1_ABSGL|nr:hypothetical protein [Absidia glauca]
MSTCTTPLSPSMTPIVYWALLSSDFVANGKGTSQYSNPDLTFSLPLFCMNPQSRLKRTYGMVVDTVSAWDFHGDDAY